MRSIIRGLFAYLAWFLVTAQAPAAVVVYQNDFNSPVGFVAGPTYTDVSQQLVQTLFPSTFQQTNTVETLRIVGSAVYSDPSGIGGAYVLGMLSTLQDDKLALTLNVGALSFVNVYLDISAADLSGSNAPFGPDPSTAPQFDLRLFDSPGGVFNFGAPGTVLDSATINGTSSSRYVFDWTNHIVALSTSGNTDGFVTLQIDLLVAPYAAFDNLIIASSDTEGDVGGGFSRVPEPATLAIFGFALAGLSLMRRRRRTA